MSVADTCKYLLQIAETIMFHQSTRVECLQHTKGLLQKSHTLDVRKHVSAFHWLDYERYLCDKSKCQ